LCQYYIMSCAFVAMGEKSCKTKNPVNLDFESSLPDTFNKSLNFYHEHLRLRISAGVAPISECLEYFLNNSRHSSVRDIRD
jgi:hypothetical protein